MKRIMLICSLALCFAVCHAQQEGHWDENTGRSTTAEASRAGGFSAVEMQVEGKVLTFSHLPETSQEIKVVITDNQGAEVTQRSLSPLHNVMDVRNLHKGKMYFVTLQCDGKTCRAFTLRL